MKGQSGALSILLAGILAGGAFSFSAVHVFLLAPETAGKLAIGLGISLAIFVAATEYGDLTPPP